MRKPSTAKKADSAAAKRKTARKPTKTKATSEGLAPTVVVSEEPRGRGQPTGYKVEYVEQARKLAEYGLTDAEIARFFDVHVGTIYRWQAAHPDFCKALKIGKDPADDRVERSLYHKACGYTFESEKIFNYQGEVVRAKCVEHVPPDTTAAIFWLKNRRKEQWRDRHEHTGADGTPLIPVLNVVYGSSSQSLAAS